MYKYNNYRNNDFTSIHTLTHNFIYELSPLPYSVQIKLYKM